VRDYRGSGRSAGRETVARVAAGAVARSLLARAGVTVRGGTVQVGSLTANGRDWGAAEENPVRCPDAGAAAKMVRAFLEARDAGDSLGGVVEVVAEGVPAGLGDPVFD
jgi:chorismate synthase